MTRLLTLTSLLLLLLNSVAAQTFVQRKGHQLYLNGRPYYFMGTNYWYGSLLPLYPEAARGINRLRRELDFLKANGVTNLRVLAGAEGSGLVSGVERIGPPLQPAKGVFDTNMLKGLDILLTEMHQRNMKAVVFFSNNWEWSGGFLQYLHWNQQIPDSAFRSAMDWETMQDEISKFYSCDPCKTDYLKQVAIVLERTNSITGNRYKDDPTIMAWELANEPRPMRPAANAHYEKWIAETAAFIKDRDKNHLVTLGHEGEIGTRSMELYKAIHQNPHIDYLTIHIWPKNWGWYQTNKLQEEFDQVLAKTREYIQKHTALANTLNKPLVIEEFGLVRDNNRFDAGTPVSLRDKYYQAVFSLWQQSKKKGGAIAGTNFWAFNGIARPVPGQIFWKAGDDYMGDPPMEEQSLYGVFDNDETTWRLIRTFTRDSQ